MWSLFEVRTGKNVAEVPISNNENEEQGQLENLRETMKQRVKIITDKICKTRVIHYSLSPRVLAALHEFVALVYECVNVADQPEQTTSTDDSGVSSNMQCKKILVVKLYSLEDDPVT
ncbi:hypothetical protein Ancab_020059 [Ancistrocladus abbreviatus]